MTTVRRRRPIRRSTWHYFKHLPVFSVAEVLALSLAFGLVVGLVAFTIGRDQVLRDQPMPGPSFPLHKD